MSQLEQQMRHRDREMVPRFLVQAMFGLMIATLGLVAFAVWTERPKVGVMPAPPVSESIAVHFVHEGNGTYTIMGAEGPLAMSTDKAAGFIGVMGRVISTERAKRDMDLTAPVTIARRENGAVAILDDATGMTVELVGYGSDNIAAFARLLD